MVSSSTYGCGGVIRDNNVNFIIGFMGPLKSCDVNLANLSTILNGIRLCISFNIFNIGIKVDSNYSFQCLNFIDDIVCNYPLFYLARDIK